VTGGSGFIGKNLIEYLRDKFEVQCPAHSELELIDKEKVDKYFASNHVDVIVHCASKGGTRKILNEQDNLKFNLRIFFNLAAQGCRMIFLGSGAEYDRSREIKNISEEQFGLHCPKDDYGFYKYVCSKYIEKSDGIVNLRLFGVFGKYEDYEIRFISNIMARVLLGLKVEITQNMFLDYTDVRDVCRIVERFIIHEPKEKFYNVGACHGLDLLSIVKIIQDISGKKFEIEVKKKGLNREYTCDNKKLLNESKDFKFTKPEDSIKFLFDWLVSSKEKINKENLLKY